MTPYEMHKLDKKLDGLALLVRALVSVQEPRLESGTLDSFMQRVLDTGSVDEYSLSMLKATNTKPRG